MNTHEAASALIALARHVKTSREMVAKLKAAADALEAALAGQPTEATQVIEADELRVGDVIIPPGKPMTVAAIEPRWDGDKVSVRFGLSPVQHYFEPDETLEIVSRREGQS